MSADKNRVINYLELRFDYLSARNVLNNWRKVNNIKDEIESFDDAQLRSLVVYLQSQSVDAARTIAGLEKLILSDNVNETPAYVAASEAIEPVVDAPAQEAPVVEDANPVVEDAPVEEIHSVEDAPIEEIPAEDFSSDESPVDEVSADESHEPSNEGGNKKNKKKKK